jgi:hypothetical protein
MTMIEEFSMHGIVNFNILRSLLLEIVKNIAENKSCIGSLERKQTELLHLKCKKNNDKLLTPSEQDILGIYTDLCNEKASIIHDCHSCEIYEHRLGILDGKTKEISITLEKLTNENEKSRLLIEENSKNILNIGEKVETVLEKFTVSPQLHCKSFTSYFLSKFDHNKTNEFLSITVTTAKLHHATKEFVIHREQNIF